MTTTPTAPCTHGVTFPTDLDAERAVFRHLTISEIREAWPRLDGDCPLGCGYRGIAYASTAHYVAGDW